MIQILSICGFTAFSARNGQNALEKVNAQRFDLVLLKGETPEINGLEILKILRETYTPFQLPIIIIADEPGIDDEVHALAAGANDYVSTSADFSELLTRIRTQLSRKHAKEALYESEKQYSPTILHTNDGLWDWDLTIDRIYFSPRWKAMLGWEENEISDSPDEWFSRLHPDDVDRVRAHIDEYLKGRISHYESEYRMLHRDGGYLWMLGRGLAVRDENGKAYRMAGFQTDIAGSKVVDVLTALPNRILFMDRLKQSFERIKRQKDRTFALLSLDLDCFKHTNGSLDHMTRDQILVAIAGRLSTVLRTSDTISRFGRSHKVERIGEALFTILLEDISSALDAARVAKRILGDLAKPLVVGEQTVFPAASIGIAIYSQTYQDPEELVRDADIAMSRAKAAGKGRYEIFDPKIRAETSARLKLENELNRAIERKEFENYYQPIISLNLGMVCGFEALVRWNNPARGLIQPSEFIPVAEEIGLIVPMSWWILETACKQMHLWQAHFKHDPPLMISVNLSARHLLQFDLIQRCSSILSEANLSPSSLNIEVTESAIMSNPEPVIDSMHKLKELGIEITLDDFGTGHSSLSYLRQCPFDSVKIDYSLAARVKEDNEMVRAILTLGRNLGMQVITEGVEASEQVKILQALRCEFAQGYYFSPPINAQEATDLLASKRRWPASPEATSSKKLPSTENQHIDSNIA